MSDEDIYRRIDQLEQQIAELRSKLPPPPDWKGPRVDPDGNLEDQKEGLPFRVRSEQELELDHRLPDLARQILDALPVQVYIKRAERIQLEDGRYARLLTYLNQTVRDRMKQSAGKGWPRQDKSRTDRDFFLAGTEGDHVHESLLDREGKALTEKTSRMTSQAWEMGDGTWTQNDNIEIPILSQDGDSIGFCSIAQDMVFEHAADQVAIYQLSTLHRVGNLNNNLDLPLKNAKAYIHKYLDAKSNQAKNNRDRPVEDMLVKASSLIAQTRNEIGLFVKLTDSQTKALNSSVHKANSGTIQSILDRIETDYKDLGFNIDVEDPSEADKNKEAPQPDVIIGVLSIFIGNALGKHQPDRSDASPKSCRIRCSVGEGKMSWSVINSCEDTCEEYQISDKIATFESAPKKRFDQIFLTYLLRHSFPNRMPSDMISTKRSGELGGGFFTATFTI